MNIVHTKYVVMNGFQLRLSLHSMLFDVFLCCCCCCANEIFGVEVEEGTQLRTSVLLEFNDTLLAYAFPQKFFHVFYFSLYHHTGKKSRLHHQSLLHLTCNWKYKFSAILNLSKYLNLESFKLDQTVNSSKSFIFFCR